MKSLRKSFFWLTLVLSVLSATAARKATGADTNLVLQFALTNLAVGETVGRAPLLVVRTGPKNGIVSVDYATSGGSAVAPDDYTETSGTLVFSNGVTTRTILVPIVNDSVAEAKETFTVTLSNPSSGVSLGARSQAVVNIMNDDVSGTISLGAKVYSSGETSGVVQVTVLRAGGKASGAAVTLQTIDGTATSGTGNNDDYVGTNVVVTFGSNEVKKVVSIRLLDDVRAEGPETFQIRLSDPTGGAKLGPGTNAIVTILDNEVPVEGTYQIAGTFTQSKCGNSDANGATPIVGKLVLENQQGNSFTGRGLYLATKVTAYQRQQLVGQVDAAGKVTGTYFWNEGQSVSGTGAFTGKIVGKILQLNQVARQNGDSCEQKVIVAATVPATNQAGFAPNAAPTNVWRVAITKATGGLAPARNVDLSVSPGDDSITIQQAPGGSVIADGKYLYRKTAPNVATLTLSLDAADLTMISSFTFTSPTGGTYSAKALTEAGTQSGSFVVVP